MASVEFVIKNINTGKYIHPRMDHPGAPIENDCDLWLWDGCQHDYVRFVFEPVDGLWGYIRHVSSDKVWHPKKDTHLGDDIWGYFVEATSDKVWNPKTNIVLHSDRERLALFAIDQVQNQIIHRDGMFVQHKEGTNPYPPNFTRINFGDHRHEGMQWAFVNPNNPSEEVKPYGAPKIVGEWRCVYSVEDSIAAMSRTYTYRTGKEQTHSTDKSFEFTWEASASAGNEFLTFAEANTSAALTTQIATSSSDTWTEEYEVTDTIEVEPGKSVAVWQKVFIGEQFDHKAVYQSNIFKHTESIHIMPED